MKCANINSPEFKELLKDTNLPSFKLSSIIGVLSENQNDDYFPSISEINNYIKGQNNVNYSLKAVEILSSDKAKQIFEKGKKNGWDLNKILSELQIPKEQGNIIKEYAVNRVNNIFNKLEKLCN